MMGMALGCNCIFIGWPLNLPVLSWKSQGNVLVSACMVLSISVWVCPPEMTPVVGASIFFNREI